MPPAATTGSFTASTTWGTSASVPISPVCPPASVPWAATTSAPAASARTACFTFPTITMIVIPCACISTTCFSGTASPATKIVTPSS